MNMLYLVVALVVIAIYLIIEYNSIVQLKESVENAKAQIEVQLKRRADLIPNLVEAVKGYVKHERETLEKIVALRSRLTTGNLKDRMKANAELNTTLSQLLVVVEDYPQLKANANFLALQEELTSTENKLAYARQAYNDAIYLYNTKIQQFPTNIIAKIFGFKEEEYLELKVPETAPKVRF